MHRSHTAAAAAALSLWPKALRNDGSPIDSHKTILHRSHLLSAHFQQHYEHYGYGGRAKKKGNVQANKAGQQKSIEMVNKSQHTRDPPQAANAAGMNQWTTRRLSINVAPRARFRSVAPTAAAASTYRIGSFCAYIILPASKAVHGCFVVLR